MHDIKIKFTPTYCYLKKDIPLVIDQALWNNLAYQEDNYFFTTMFQNNQWDGFNRRYYRNKKHNKFRSGFIYKAIQIIIDLGYNPVVEGFPEHLSFTQRTNTYTLRDYQKQAVGAMLHYRFGILQAPMRSGKTIMFIALVDSTRDFPCMFFCLNVTIARQTVAKLQQFLPVVSVGMVADGEASFGDVTVVTIQSVFAAFKKTYRTKDGEIKERKLSTEAKVELRNRLGKAKLVVYDEVHHGGTTVSRYVLDRCTAAEIKIGLSATPFTDKADSILVEESIGPVVHKVPYKELIANGFILKPVVYLYKLPEELSARGIGSYNAVYTRVVKENVFLKALVKRMVAKLNKKHHSVLIHVRHVNHAKDLAKYIGCPFLIGPDKSEKRSEVIQKLIDKDILCVVSTILGEGVDIPTLNYTINLRGGKSMIDTFQSMRSITAIEGKTTNGTIDFIFKNDYVKAHSRVRRKFYKSEPDFDIVERDVSKLSIQELTHG